MLHRLLGRIHRWAHRRQMLGLTAAVVGLSLVMNATSLPFATPTIEEYSGGLRLLDMRLSYSPAEAETYLDTLGPDGRRADLLLHLLPDVAFPICYSVLFACLAAWLLLRLAPTGHPVQLLALTPLLAGLADLTENLTLVAANLSHPDTADWLIRIASLATTIK